MQLFSKEENAENLSFQKRKHIQKNHNMLASKASVH